MKLNQRTKKLATILLELSGENAGAVQASLQLVDQLIRKDARFRSLLQSKRVTQEKKNGYPAGSTGGFMPYHRY